ncbi:MAG: DUF1285 domain-containing protein [Deltaproteobacteria bacterium]|nr:DUF1285 domain-containing protein [Candidatus Tharpella sp.]
MEISADYISIDGQGQWWYEGNKIVHPKVLSLFKSSLMIDQPTGELFIDYKGKRAPVKVEKTPFFIQDIVVKRGADGELLEVELELDDGTSEVLDPESLRLDDSGVLEVKVKQGQFAARCLQSAHFRLAELLSEDQDGGFSLVIGGKSYILTKKIGDYQGK